MAAILISVNDIKYLKTWLAINEESIYGWRLLVKTGRNDALPAIRDGLPVFFKHFYQARDAALMFSAKVSRKKAETG